MTSSLQEFLAKATLKAANDLETALLRLPKAKRNWQPSEGARSALNQVAECAIMNDSVIAMIRDGVFPKDWAYIYYREQIEELVADWPRLQKQLHDSAARVAEVIRAVTDEDLQSQADLSDSISYPYWNMAYHEGQINYIASLLSCLE